MTKKIKVVLTCFKQTSYEDYTHFFKSVEIEVPYNEGEEWHVCGEEYQEQSVKIHHLNKNLMYCIMITNHMQMLR